MKRSVDLVVSALLLVVLAPVMATIAITVLLSMGSPVLFRQKRTGKGGHPFTLLKFRTMAGEPGRDGSASDHERLTRLGALLRRWSLDELPQLWNVIRGDMSLVGPRPLPKRYMTRYTPHQARRHEVRPGITGLSQVSGRNGLDWPKRLDLDVWYVDNRSPWLDLKVLAKTPAAAVRRQGTRSENHVTMPEFHGSGAGG